MERFQFVTSPDGVRIAVSTEGSGPPVVMIPFWFSFMPVERQMPAARAFFESLFPGRLHVYYDKRGIGLSDRSPPEFSLDAQVSDLETVADSLNLPQFVLWGPGDGSCIAVAYTARHPERVSHLVLYAPYRSLESDAPLLEAIVPLMDTEWDMAAQALAQLANPTVDPEARNAIAAVIRSATSREDAVRMLRDAVAFDVTHYLSEIQTPTLVLHRRGDRVVPFQSGRELAALIPTARFVPLEGDSHTFVLGDIAPIVDAVTTFLPTLEPEDEAPPTPTAGPVTILFTDIEGSTALTQLLGDEGAQEVLRTHNQIVRQCVQVHGGSVVKTTGDGFMASFPSAGRALECAIAIQRALAQHNAGHPDISIHIRIGLNAGEPVAEDADLFGTAVQAAARICNHARPDQILAADVVRQLAAGKGFRFADRGQAHLKGLEGRHRLHEVLW
jgi:class 3 adenylate cyclase/pimeloyl-ACP methyl ester carboxylesterase